MKNPEKSAYPTLPDVDHFIRKYSGQIDLTDQKTIYSTALDLIRWYAQSEPDKAENKVKQMRTAEAKNIMLMETNIDATMRREIATIFDALAVSGGQRRWTFPTDKHGNILVKINQCYI